MSITSESATITYSVPQPFDKAVASLRKVLSHGGLKIKAELNMSDRIQRTLLVSTTPCVIFLVSPSPDANVSPGAIMPLHVVVSARGAFTEVHLLRVGPVDRGALEDGDITTLRWLQREIGQAIEKIGMRASLVV